LISKAKIAHIFIAAKFKELLIDFLDSRKYGANHQRGLSYM